jgi:hypothetical protein
MGRFGGIGMVSAESFAGGECVPALRFLADFAIGCRPLDLVFARQAAMSIERLVAAARAERFSLVHYRLRQSHTAITAPLTGLGIKIDHLEILLKMKRPGAMAKSCGGFENDWSGRPRRTSGRRHGRYPAARAQAAGIRRPEMAAGSFKATGCKPRRSPRKKTGSPSCRSYWKSCEG